MLDGLLQFTGTAGSAAAMTDSPTTGTQQSTNVLDLLNARDLGIAHFREPSCQPRPAQVRHKPSRVSSVSSTLRSERMARAHWPASSCWIVRTKSLIPLAL
jgi:hypothetical protein